MKEKKIVKCKACKGSKLIHSIGGIYHECRACHGIGHVEYTNDDYSDDEFINNHEVKVMTMELRPKRKYVKRVNKEKNVNNLNTIKLDLTHDS